MQKVGTKTELMSAGGRMVAEINGQKILVQELDGEVYAVSNKCSHLGLPLQGKILKAEMKNGCVVCAAHGTAFDVKVRGPTAPPRALATSAWPPPRGPPLTLPRGPWMFADRCRSGRVVPQAPQPSPCRQGPRREAPPHLQGEPSGTFPPPPLPQAPLCPGPLAPTPISRQKPLFRRRWRSLPTAISLSTSELAPRGPPVPLLSLPCASGAPGRVDAVTQTPRRSRADDA